MSKRLQVLIPDSEYEAALSVVKKKKITMASLVRAGLKEVTREMSEPTKSNRLSQLLQLSANNGPTGEIEDILDEIEKGRNINDIL